MIDLSAIENGVYAWCTDQIGGTTFIFEDQNAPIPDGSFATIKVVSVAKIAHDSMVYEYQQDNDKFKESVEGVRSALVSVNFYRDSAFNKAAQLHASLQKTNVTDLLWNNGLSFVQVSDIRDMDEIISAEWEQRAQFDITFYVNSGYNELIDRIDKVNVIKVNEL